MTGLTSLRCSSPHGFSQGGLASLRRLTLLRRLELTDAPRTWRDDDVEAIARMTRLTRLALGGGTSMLRVLLRRVAEVNGCPVVEAPAAGAGARGGLPGVAFGLLGGQQPQQQPQQPQQQQQQQQQQQPQQQQQQQPPIHPGNADPRLKAGSAEEGSSGGAGGGLQLRELDVMFDWMHTSNADLLPAVARLTSLTSLTVRAVLLWGGACCAVLGWCVLRCFVLVVSVVSANAQPRPKPTHNSTDRLAGPEHAQQQHGAPHAPAQLHAADRAVEPQVAAAAQRGVARG